MSAVDCVPVPPPQPRPDAGPPNLTTEQEDMYNKVCEHFTKDGYALPGEEKGELTEEEKFWLVCYYPYGVSMLRGADGLCYTQSYECLLRCVHTPSSESQSRSRHIFSSSRFLRATKWDVGKAIVRLESTLKWRREFGVYTHTPEHVEPEVRVPLPHSPHTDWTILPKFVTGKQVLFGYDTESRPALYLFPSRQNTEISDRQIHQVVWTLERATDLMGPGTELVFQRYSLVPTFLIRSTLEPWHSWLTTETRARARLSQLASK